MSLKIGDWRVNLSEDSYPRELVLEVSTRCNLDCIHCFRYAAERFKLLDMCFEDYKKVIDNAVNSNIKRLVLTGWGEPTINPYILDMLNYAKSKNLIVVLNTNGTKLPEIAEDLVKINIDELYVSIDAIDVDLYEKIRRLGNLSIVSKGLEKLFEYKKRIDSRKPIVKSIFTITKLNAYQIPKILDYAVEAGIFEVYLSFYIHYPGGVEGVSCLDDPECIEKLKEQMGKVSVMA
ncbi:MAG: radical SAM protein, partial [archaeon GBS-70-058]|nr:radical SAM protein [Candidatus Culexarchaeum nevadense]